MIKPKFCHFAKMFDECYNVFLKKKKARKGIFFIVKCSYEYFMFVREFFVEV